MKKNLSIPLLLMTISFSVSNSLADFGESDTDGKVNSQHYKDAERLIYKERFAEAIEKLDKVLSRDKMNADAWNLFGYASRNTGNLVSADKAYARALDLDPEHRGALEYQGEMFIMQGRIDKAENNLAKLEILCPDSCAELEDLAEAINKSKQ